MEGVGGRIGPDSGGRQSLGVDRSDGQLQDSKTVKQQSQNPTINNSPE